MILHLMVFIGVFSFMKFAYSSENYKIYNLESDAVCSQKFQIFSKRISTGTDGLIVREVTYFDRLSGKYDFTCRFEVETGHKSDLSGLFVVIQKLNLRRNPVTGDCIDYVKLRPVDNILREIVSINFNLKKNKDPWEMFCGDLSARRDGSRESSQSKGLSVVGFLTFNHTVEVEVHIGKIPTLNESLQLEMSFTPYKTCKNAWSEYRDCGNNKCIKKQSFNDGVVNCPFLNCPDEDGCDVSIIEDDSLPPGLRTKVTLTAVTSIFCSFFLFLGCIWCCRYFELLCWGASSLLGRTSPVELSPMQQPSPSAPTCDSTKDLPPAYETLFPDRSDFPRIANHSYKIRNPGSKFYEVEIWKNECS